MSDSTPLYTLSSMGQSIWLDYIRRDLIDSGELNRMINEDGLRGMTSNPSIFDKAISEGQLYDEMLLEAHRRDPNLSPEELFFELAINDIRAAADLFSGIYQDSRQRDGFVSLEVSPEIANEPDATVNEALALFQKVARPNLMIKVPATRAGLQAIRHLTEAGLNINVTLLFAVARYSAVSDAYMEGLEARLDQGLSLAGINSVASFFISRLDTLLDGRLAVLSDTHAHDLAGRCAIANARLAYAEFMKTLESPRWKRLEQAGANPQRLLWASTSTKNPEYPPLLYVDELIGAHTVNTLPPTTYQTLLQRNTFLSSTLPGDLAAAKECIDRLGAYGIDLTEATDELEIQGVASFNEAYHHLLNSIEQRLDHIKAKP